MGFSGFDSIISQLGKANLDEIGRRAAPAVESRLRDIIRDHDFVPRKDGGASTANELADRATVAWTGSSFTVTIDHPAATFLESGTVKMAARPLYDDEELEAILQNALETAVAEVMR